MTTRTAPAISLRQILEQTPVDRQRICKCGHPEGDHEDHAYTSTALCWHVDDESLHVCRCENFQPQII